MSYSLNQIIDKSHIATREKEKRVVGVAIMCDREGKDGVMNEWIVGLGV